VPPAVAGFLGSLQDKQEKKAKSVKTGKTYGNKKTVEQGWKKRKVRLNPLKNLAFRCFAHARKEGV